MHTGRLEPTPSQPTQPSDRSNRTTRRITFADIAADVAVIAVVVAVEFALAVYNHPIVGACLWHPQIDPQNALFFIEVKSDP